VGGVSSGGCGWDFKGGKSGKFIGVNYVVRWVNWIDV